MIVLQTLGVYAQTQQAGIFQYCRTPNGIYIDMSIGQTVNGSDFEIPSEDWQNMLRQLATGNRVFNLTDLKNAISSILGTDGSKASCIVAILEHEGSFDHYGGVIGGGDSVSMHLRRQY